MEFNVKKAFELFQTERTITEAVRKHCIELGIPYEEKYRHKLSRLVNKEKDEDIDNVTFTDSVNYSNDIEKVQPGFSAIAPNGTLFNINQYCEYYGLDFSKIRSYKLITHTGRPFFNVVFFNEDEEESVANIENSLDEIVQKFIKPIPVEKVSADLFSDDEWFDRLVYTDVHINMNVNGKGGSPLYEGVWNEAEVLRRLDLMIEHVINFKVSNTLVISELGDFLDGLGGQTTRKGHELPQNTSDKEAFELALKFKIRLIDSLVPHFDTIICNDITNDNHAGYFAYFASSATAKILMERYPGIVEVNTLTRFINHFSIGKHTFVELHGKDMESMKHGFKPKLDAVQAEKLDHYCKQNGLYNGNYIEVSKGDSHQALYDDATSSDFSYYNYPAFSPPSDWVKTNFSNSRSGFNFFNIHRKKNLKVAIPYWF